MRADFATVLTGGGEVVGLEFEKALDQTRLEEALGAREAGEGGEWGVEKFVDSLNGNGRTEYFINYIKTKRGGDYKRGSVVWALAVGSRQPCIEPYKKLLAVALNEFMATLVEGKGTLPDAQRLA